MLRRRDDAFDNLSYVQSGIVETIEMGLQEEIYAFQNFLLHPPFLATNLKPNTDGIVELEFSTSRYSTMIVIATDSHSTMQKIVPLDRAEEKAKREL